MRLFLSTVILTVLREQQKKDSDSEVRIAIFMFHPLTPREKSLVPIFWEDTLTPPSGLDVVTKIYLYSE